MSISIHELISLAKDKARVERLSTSAGYEMELNHQLEKIICNFSTVDYLEALAVLDINFTEVAAANADNFLNIEGALAEAIYKEVRWSNEFFDAATKSFTPTTSEIFI